MNTTRYVTTVSALALSAVIAIAPRAEAQTFIHLTDGDVQGQTERRDARVPRYPVRCAAGRSLRWKPPQPDDAVGRHAGRDQLLIALRAVARAHRHAERERGLPLSERVDAGSCADRTQAGHDLDPRRLQLCRAPPATACRSPATTACISTTATRWRVRRTWSSSPSIIASACSASSVTPISRAKTRAIPHAGNQGLLDQRAAMQWVQRQYRGVRRRPGQRHDLRRVGRILRRMRPRRFTAERGALPSRDQRERRLHRR